MRKLRSNTRECKRRVRRRNKLKTSLIPRVLKSCSETQLGRAIQNVDNPMIAPRDYEVRQSGRVLELQNKDLWIRPTDLSWHFAILVIIRELQFKKFRGKSSANVEAMDADKKQQSDQTHKDTTWQSHFYWQWTLLYRLFRQRHPWRRK